MVHYSKNFTDIDFPIGIPHQDFLAKLQASRDEYGQVMVITRGGSTPEHNSDVGGKKDSAHLLNHDGRFRAVDISCVISHDRFKMLPILLRHFSRIGVYPAHLHVDDDPDKPQGVVWVGDD